MMRTLMTSKIHRATVTQADLHYVGSVTIDADLVEAAGLVEHEQVTIADITSGARLVTYVIAGERGSGVIGINGAAAHLVSPGDLVIIMAYGQLEAAEIPGHHPRVVHVDGENRIVAIGDDGAEPVPGMPQLAFGHPEQGRFLIASIVWLFIIFGILYYVMATYALPGVAQVLETRRARIEGDLEQAQAATNGQVAEGVKSCTSIRELSRRAGVEMPLTEAVHEICHEGGDAVEVAVRLMSRSTKAE